jgi:hypothetical protein
VRHGGFEHAWALAQSAVALHELLPDWRMLSEHEIRAHECYERDLLASARGGSLTGDGPALRWTIRRRSPPPSTERPAMLIV